MEIRTHLAQHGLAGHGADGNVDPYSASNTCSPRSRGRCDQLGQYPRRPGAATLCYQFLENGLQLRKTLRHRLQDPGPHQIKTVSAIKTPRSRAFQAQKENHAADAHFFRHLAGMKRTGSAKRHEGERPHIIAAPRKSGGSRTMFELTTEMMPLALIYGQAGVGTDLVPNGRFRQTAVHIHRPPNILLGLSLPRMRLASVTVGSSPPSM